MPIVQDHHEMGLNRTKMFVSVNEKAKSAAKQGMNGTRPDLRLHLHIELQQPKQLLQTRHPPSRGQQQINTLAFVLPLWVQTINKYHSTRRGLSRRQTAGVGRLRGLAAFQFARTACAAFRLANLSSFN